MKKLIYHPLKITIPILMMGELVIQNIISKRIDLIKNILPNVDFKQFKKETINDLSTTYILEFEGQYFDEDMVVELEFNRHAFSKDDGTIGQCGLLRSVYYTEKLFHDKFHESDIGDEIVEDIDC
jgi:hypothetical protein